MDSTRNSDRVPRNQLEGCFTNRSCCTVGCAVDRACLVACSENHMSSAKDPRRVIDITCNHSGLEGRKNLVCSPPPEMGFVSWFGLKVLALSIGLFTITWFDR